MKFISTILLSMTLVGCDQLGFKSQDSQNTNHDYENVVCVSTRLNDSEELKHCKPGQKIYFVPKSWGNAQLPIMFASGHCDLRYSVVWTEGAVSCIYRPVEVSSNYEFDEKGQWKIKK